MIPGRVRCDLIMDRKDHGVWKFDQQGIGMKEKAGVDQDRWIGLEKVIYTSLKLVADALAKGKFIRDNCFFQLKRQLIIAIEMEGMKFITWLEVVYFTKGREFLRPCRLHDEQQEEQDAGVIGLHGPVFPKYTNSGPKVQMILVF